MRVYDLCLRGIGVLNYEGYKVSGEDWFLHAFLRDKHVKVIVDVGANVDPYGAGLFGVKVYALEPNRNTFRKLQKVTKNISNIFCFPIGLSDKSGSSFLYDVSSDGTALASLDQDNIRRVTVGKIAKNKISLTTLDKFAFDQKIDQLDLLKIDTEGNEYKVLRGAKKMLSQGRVRFILFEFNEMHAYNRSFLRDFIDLLQNFTLYRLLPDGLAPLGTYAPLTHEIFAFQNIVAIKNMTKVSSLR